MTKIKIFAVSLFSFWTLALAAKDYKASMFGVKSDGTTLNTRSIQKAVDFINENGGGRLVFYVGRYLTGSIQLKSNVTIQLEEGAVLVGVTSIYDYIGINGKKALFIADNQINIGITGKGVIEGQGAAILDNINTQIQKGYIKETLDQASPMLIYMNDCSNIIIEQVNIQNACGKVQSYNKCKDINIHKIIIKSTAVTNSDGMLISGCDGLKLKDSFFDTSGAELTSDNTSKNISIINCITPKGKKIQTKQ